MQLRRSFALTAFAVALTAGLSSCGFDAATDRVYTPATGVNSSGDDVKVSGAVVVSTEPGSGTLIASLSNSSEGEETALTEVTGDFEPVELEPIAIQPGQLVNLAEPAADIKITGDFEAGNWVELTFGFDNGESIVLEAPVVENANYYADLDGAAPPEEPAEESAESDEAAH